MDNIICQISINPHNFLTVTNKTNTFNIDGSWFPTLPPDLQEMIEAIKVIGDGDFGLTPQQLDILQECHASIIRSSTPEIVSEIKNHILGTENQNSIPKSENEIPKLKFPVVSRQKVYFQTDDGNFIESPHNKAIVNLESNKTYSVVSNRYKLQQHEEAIDKMREALHKTGLNDYKEEIDFSKDGSFMSAEYTFDKIKHEVSVGDYVSPMLKCYNSYNVGDSFKAFMSALRLACTNGMTRAEKLGQYIKMHTASLDMDQMQTVMIDSIENFKTQVDSWQRWTVLPATQELLDKSQKVLGKRDFTEMMNLRETTTGTTLASLTHVEPIKNEEGENEPKLILDSKDVTQWLLYNIFTQYITHRINSNKKRMRSLEALGRVFNT